MVRIGYSVKLVFTNLGTGKAQEVKLDTTHLPERLHIKKSQAIRLAYKHCVGYKMDPEMGEDNALEDIQAYSVKSNTHFQIIQTGSYREQGEDYIWQDAEKVDILYSTH